MFFSPKTIEYHLRNVYRKLGVHSRPELAGQLLRGCAQHLRGLLIHERSAGWPDRAQRTTAGTTSRKRS
jgi:hypothetical protein